MGALGGMPGQLFREILAPMESKASKLGWSPHLLDVGIIISLHPYCQLCGLLNGLLQGLPCREGRDTALPASCAPVLYPE